MPFINDVLEQNKREISNQNGFSRFNFNHQAMMHHLREHIIAQDDALCEIEKFLKVIKANISNPQKPLGVFLLIGPTGVGKTQTIRLIAECIYGSMDQFCRIDMNTLSQEHYSASLTGAPPGYVGSKEGNTLFDIPLIEGSYSKPGIVLFDEIEKANPQVIRSLLNVIDSGKMTLASGNKTIDFKNSIIFMTSNLGSKKLIRFQNSFSYKLYKAFGIVTEKKENKILQSSLKEFFDPEFLNRLDAVLYYKKIQADCIRKIILLELKNLNQRLEEKNLEISLSENALKALENLYDSRYSARDVGRKFRTHIEPLIADWILSTQEHQASIKINFKNKDFFIDAKNSSHHT